MERFRGWNESRKWKRMKETSVEEAEDEGIRQEKVTIENNGREGRHSCRELKGGRKWKRRKENW